MRGGFERSFDLDDFIRYARSKLGYEANEMAFVEIAYKFFGSLYDRLRWDIGIGMILSS